MNVPDKGARRNGGDAAGGNLGAGKHGFNANSTDRSDARSTRSIAAKRRISRQLGDVIESLDGPTRPALPPRSGEACPRWCAAMTREQMHYWFEKVGSCPCPSARQAANRIYADRLNSQRKINNMLEGTDSFQHMSPALVEMMGLHPNAVRHALHQSLGGGLKPGQWARRMGKGKGARFFATGKGLKTKPHGWTVEQITQTPEEIGADMAMREVIRMLRPHMHQQTHKFTQAEWNAIRHWLQLAAINWQP